MTPGAYPCPTSNGDQVAEPLLCFDRDRAWRLLIVPALFDEANRMRRFTVEVMRRLDGAGVDSFLPDLPGCGESLQPLERQTPSIWRTALASAARHVRATHVLGIRGGSLMLPEGLPGWRLAPVNGTSLLRQMLRARIIVAREAGTEETQAGLMEQGLARGLELAGYRLGPHFLAEFQSLTPPVSPGLVDIGQDMLGGGGLWLRAEPDEDALQADALAAILAIGIRN